MKCYQLRSIIGTDILSLRILPTKDVVLKEWTFSSQPPSVNPPDKLHFTNISINLHWYFSPNEVN